MKYLKSFTESINKDDYYTKVEDREYEDLMRKLYEFNNSEISRLRNRLRKFTKVNKVESIIVRPTNKKTITIEVNPNSSSMNSRWVVHKISKDDEWFTVRCMGAIYKCDQIEAVAKFFEDWIMERKHNRFSEYTT